MIPRGMPLLLLITSLLLPVGTPEVVAQRSQEAGQGLDGRIVSDVEVTGLVSMDGEVVLRRMKLRKGALWRSDLARRDERALNALGIFHSVRIHAEAASGADQEVRVRVDLRERQPWFVAPEASYTAEEGWSVGLFGGHLNLRARGDQFFVTARTGGTSVVRVGFVNPWSGPHHENYRLQIEQVRADNRLYRFREEGERFDMEVGRWTGPLKRGRLGSGFRYRRVRPDLAGMTISGSEQDVMMGIWGIAGLETGDEWAYPPTGWILGVRWDGLGYLLGGDVDGGRWQSMLQHTALIGGRLVLAGRLYHSWRYGEAPFWSLQAMGGPSALRGYGLGTWLVSRRWEANGELQWYLVPMHVERVPLLGEQIVGISAAIFADMGRGAGVQRGPDPGPWPKRTPLLSSIGAGIRFHNVLMGTVRVEIAWAREGGRAIFVAFGEFLPRDLRTGLPH